MTFCKVRTCIHSMVKLSFLWKWIVLYQVAVTTNPCCCFTFVIKNMVVTQMSAIAGESAFLPCNITTDDEQDDYVLLVLWYREDLGTPIFSVDGRGKEFVVAERWSDDGAFSNRAYFLPNKRPAELVVEKLKISDSGLYRCRVDFKTGQSRNSRVNLTVVVPPRHLVVLDDKDNEKKAIVGPFTEGAAILLNCIVYEGWPSPWIKWYKDDEEISSNYSRTDVGNERGHSKDVPPRTKGLETARSSLLISNLTRADVNSMLSCRAGNNDKLQPLENVLRIDMNLLPLSVSIVGGYQPLSENRRYDLLCQSSGSRPPASITWWKNGIRLENTKDTTSIDGNTTTSSLSLVPKQSDHGKRLTCKAHNNILQSKQLEDSWILQVNYLPMASARLGTNLDETNIREGIDVYFDCIIKTRPPVYKVEWRQDGRTLVHNVASGVIISNHSLVLQAVGRETAGNYTCLGYNAEGTGESRPFHLDVLYSPKCSLNQTRVHGIAKQEKAHITCEIDANPHNVNFRWAFNNTPDSLDFRTLNRAGTSSIVSYIPLTELDYGTLLCWASNSIGEQRVPCVYHIIAAGRPDQVQNCSIMNASLTSFSISCTDSFNGGLPQSFLLEVRERQTQELKVNTTSLMPRFSVANLRPGTNYIAAVTAFNVKGRSDSYILPASTIRPPQMHHVPDDDALSLRNYIHFVSPTNALLCGAFILMLMAIILIAIVRRRCVKNKRQGQKESEGQVSPSDSSDAMHPLRSPSADNVKVKVKARTFALSHDGRLGSSGTEDCNPDIISDRIADIQHISTIESSVMRRNVAQNSISFGCFLPPPEFPESCRTIRPIITEGDENFANNAITGRQDYNEPFNSDDAQTLWTMRPANFAILQPSQCPEIFTRIHHLEPKRLVEIDDRGQLLYPTVRRQRPKMNGEDATCKSADSIPLKHISQSCYISNDER